MALTRITKGVIKPNENYDTHDINSTGIITATGLNISGNASIGGVLTYEDVTNIDSIGIITARSGVDVDDFLSVGSNIHLGNAGVVTATKFIATGDNSYLKYLQVDSMEINSGLPRISLNDTNQENDYDIRVNNGQFQIYDQDTSDSTKERFIVESDGTVNITKGPFTVGTGVTLTSAGAGFYAGIITAANFEKSDGSPIAQVGGATSITMNDNVPINFGTDALWRQYRQGDILYLKPANTTSTAQLWIESNNQMWIRSNANGTFFDCNGTRNVELYQTTFNHKTDVQIPDKIIHANDTNTAIRFPENDTFTVETAGTERLRINNTGITTLSGITTVTGNTLFADQLGVAGVSTFIGEIHGNGQRLGSLSGGGRFSGLFLNDGNSYYGGNKLFVANGNGFGLDAYGSNDAWLKANSGGGTDGDCWMKTGGSSGGYIIAKGADGVELHHSGTSDKKLETVSGGINVVGSITVNGAALQSGITGIDTTGTSHFNNLSVTGIATFSGTEAIFNRVSFPQSGNKTIVGNMAGGSGPTGTEITVVGYGAGYASSGNKLTAIGRMSGRMVSGPNNTIVGYEAGYSNQGAQDNVFIGKDAGMGNKTGSDNVVVGTDAGEGVWNNANYTNSVILGGEAGATLTSNNSNVIVIGYDAEPSSASVTNEITLGNSSINHLRIPGIGVTFATSGNHITGITTFKDRIKLGNSGNGQLYYSGGIKMESTAQIELKSANQMYLHAQSSGLFLFASNQEVLSVYGGYGGGIYFKNNNTQYLKLEYGNWTYQNSPTVTFDNHLYASSDSAIDIGTNSVRFRNIYADTLYGDGSNLTGISGGGGGGVTSDSEENTVGGTDAGAALDSDTYRNTLFGFDTGKVINSGDDNTIMGWKAGDAITSGYKNCAVGSEALPNCNSGHNNVAMGWEAGRSLTSGNNNVCLGPMAGRSLGGGTYNVALGYHALSNTGSPTRCIGIGGDSIFLGGTDVIGIGQGTMQKGNSQIGGIGIGRYAGRQNAGDHNVYIGYESGEGYSSSPYSTGNYNIGMGYQSLNAIKGGNDNVAIGASSGKNIDDGFGHVFIGVNAGAGVTTEQQSVYIGYEAAENTHKGRQVAIGWRALRYTGNSTPGYRGNNHTAIGNNCMSNLSIYSNYNTAVGDAAMQNATAGFNAAFGYGALRSGSGEINTALGMNALNNTSGSWNCAIGYNAGDDCTGGSKNCLLGVYAGEDIGSGSHNVCLGAYSTVSASGVSNECVIGAPSGHASEINHVRIPGIGVSFSDGGAVISGVVTATSFVGDGSALTGVGGGVSSDSNQNTVGGTNAGDSITSGTNNTLFGYNTGTDITTSENNTAFGHNALASLASGGGYHTAIGLGALQSYNTQGYSNTAVGIYAMQNSTSSQNSTAVGYGALKNNTSGTQNTAIGSQALWKCSTGNYNTAVGNSCAEDLTSATRNVAMGWLALKDHTTGNSNIAIGVEAMRTGSGGSGAYHNVAIGDEALEAITNGAKNTSIGYNANLNVTSGEKNTALGSESGDNITTGNNNICIGYNADASSATVSNEVTIGDANITNFRVPGVHIGITANAASLPAAIFRPGVIQETVHNYTSAITGTYNHDILSYGMVWNGTANASGAFTFNIRGDASTTFNSLTSTGKVTTMTIYSTNNNASNYMSAFQIDGSTQTVKWAGGSAPSAATGSGVDVYSLTIMKTAANTYDVFGNVTNFA